MGAGLSRDTKGTAAVVAGGIAVALYVSFHRRRRPFEPPLESGCIPFIGCGFEFARDFGSLITRLRAKHGTVFTILNFGKRMTFVTDVRSIRKVWTLQKQFNFDDFGLQAESRLSGLETVEEMRARGGGSMVLAIHAKEMRGPDALEGLAERFLDALKAAAQEVSFLRGGGGAADTDQWQSMDLREFMGVLVWFAAGRSLLGAAWLQGVDPVESYRRYEEFDAAVPLIIGGLPRIATKQGCDARDFLVRSVMAPAVAGYGEDAHPYLKRYLDTMRKNYADIENGELLLGGRIVGLVHAVMTNTMHLGFWTLARLLTIPPVARDSIEVEVANAMKGYSFYREFRKSVENKNGANVLETQYFLKFLQFVGSQTCKQLHAQREQSKQARREAYKSDDTEKYREIVSEMIMLEDQVAQDVLKVALQSAHIDEQQFAARHMQLSQDQQYAQFVMAAQQGKLAPPKTDVQPKLNKQETIKHLKTTAEVQVKAMKEAQATMTAQPTGHEEQMKLVVDMMVSQCRSQDEIYFKTGEQHENEDFEAALLSWSQCDPDVAKELQQYMLQMQGGMGGMGM